jgi:hypothetical protein
MKLVYDFTNYWTQGQTIEAAVVDTKEPPSRSKLALFNLYPALSRSSCRDNIYILYLVQHSYCGINGIPTRILVNTTR